MVLKAFGVEGETYTVQKGEDGQEHFIYTDKIKDHESIGTHSVEAAGRNNLDAAISNIILGKADIKSYDKIIEQAKKDGYDELLEIYQAAYYRYLKLLSK